MSPGFFRVRKGGEPHTKDKDTVQALNDLTLVQETGDNGQDRDMLVAHLLQAAIRSESSERYDAFAKLANDRALVELHDLLELAPPGEPIPLDEVEPVTNRAALLDRRHVARRTVEGGARDAGAGRRPARYRTRGQGRDDKNSKIKQIAIETVRRHASPTWRTPTSCRSRSRGAQARRGRPASGPQGLARDRPPAHPARRRPHLAAPHHDIYSIEDLAQLIYDLKQVNAAQVGQARGRGGREPIAAGCVKALADVVHISGQNGGTGASPLSSIKREACLGSWAWPTPSVSLVDNDLRSRVRLRVDGSLERQVIVAALLGADEFGLGTAAMIAEGCIMLRLPRTIASRASPPNGPTYGPTSRARRRAWPRTSCSWPRRYGATWPLGLRTLDEAVGRDLLRQRAAGYLGPTPWTSRPCWRRRRRAPPLRRASSCRIRAPTWAIGCWPTPSRACGTATTSTSPTTSATPTAPSAPRCRGPSQPSTPTWPRGYQGAVPGTAGRASPPS